MSEKIITEYLVEVGQLKARMKEVETSMRSAGDAGQASMNKISEGAEKAGKTWSEFIKGKMGPYMKELGSHGAAIAKIAEEWKEYKKSGVEAIGKVDHSMHQMGNTAHVATNKATTGMSLMGKAGESLRSQFVEIGKGLVAAFAVTEVINFGKECVKAFHDAELNATKLKAAVMGNGGTVEGFKRLIAQSERLQKTTIFSDDTIQQVQTLGAQFGYSAKQIEALMPILTDFASGANLSLNDALEAVIRGTEGSGRALKVYGVDVKHTGDLSADTAFITQQLTDKFGGMSEVLASSTTGQIKMFYNQLDELHEFLGGKFEGQLVSTLGTLKDLTDVIGLTTKSNDALSSAVSYGARQYDKFITIQKRLLGSTFDLDEAEKKYLSDLKSRSDGSKEQIELYNKLQDVIRKRTGQMREEAKDTVIAIKNVAFYKTEISRLQEVIEDRLSTETDITKAVKDQAIAQEKLDLLLGKETVSMKRLREEQEKLSELRKKEFEERKKLNEQANAIEQELAVSKLKTIQSTEDKASDAKDQAMSDQMDKTKANAQKEIAINKEINDQKVRDEERAAAQKQQIIDASFNAAQQLVTSFQQISDNAYQQDLMNLQDQLDKKQISQEQFDAKQKQMRQKQAEDNKLFAVFNTILGTAQAIVAALAPPNVPPFSFVLAAIAGAIGTAQLAVIASQPVPQFAEGTEFVKRGRNKPGRDTIPALLNEGEAIINADYNSRYPGLAAAWNGGNLDRYILSNYVVPAIREYQSKQEKQNSESFAHQIAKAIVMNQKGFKDNNLLDSDKTTRGVLREQTAVLKSLADQRRDKYRY